MSKNIPISFEAISSICGKAWLLIRNEPKDDTDKQLRLMARKCAEAFMLAAEDNLCDDRELKIAKESVFFLSSLDAARTMVRYPDAQQAFFILQGAANRLG